VGSVDASMLRVCKCSLRKKGRGTAMQPLVSKKLCRNLACHGTPTTQGTRFFSAHALSLCDLHFFWRGLQLLTHLSFKLKVLFLFECFICDPFRKTRINIIAERSGKGRNLKMFSIFRI
jgi:hypothetical protein